jgi:hypothetical protein
MEYINMDDAWHLGHDDKNKRIYKGPEHVQCNCATNDKERKKEPRPMIDKFWEDD